MTQCEGFTETAKRCPLTATIVLNHEGYATQGMKYHLRRTESVQHFCIRHATGNTSPKPPDCTCTYTYDHITKLTYLTHPRTKCPTHGKQKSQKAQTKKPKSEAKK